MGLFDSNSRRTNITTNKQEANTVTNTGDGLIYNLSKVDGPVSFTRVGTDGDTAIAALEQGRKVQESAFDFGGDALRTVGDTFTEAARLNRDVIKDFGGNLEQIVRQTSQQVDRSLKVAQSSLTDDSAETLQSLFKYSAIAAGLIAAVVMMRSK